jgi:hypothetical protein
VLLVQTGLQVLFFPFSLNLKLLTTKRALLRMKPQVQVYSGKLRIHPNLFGDAGACMPNQKELIYDMQHKAMPVPRYEDNWGMQCSDFKSLMGRRAKGD